MAVGLVEYCILLRYINNLIYVNIVQMLQFNHSISTQSVISHDVKNIKETFDSIALIKVSATFTIWPLADEESSLLPQLLISVWVCSETCSLSVRINESYSAVEPSRSFQMCDDRSFWPKKGWMASWRAEIWISERVYRLWYTKTETVRVYA